MNDMMTIAANSLALLIIIFFFLLIYVKVRRQTISESWDEIKYWVGGK